MKRVRFPFPFAVLVAACTTGCCSFCIRTPGPEFWEGVHEAYSTDRDPAFSVAKLAANPAVDRRVDWLERWGGDPDLSLLNGARWRARSIRPEDYPDADEISLLEWEETGYWTNGTYATQWTTLSKILTQRGLENNRTFSFSNDDFYGSTTVLVARVHSPDGSQRDIDLAANLAEAVDTGSLASNIHDPNEKTFTLALPGLQVGDAIELSMRRVAKKPRCEGVYSDYLTFESDHPSLLQVVRITGPASMPLRSRAFRDAGPVSLEHAAHTNDLFGTITEVWLAGETPRYFAEPDMPPAYDCTARLLLSTAPDWESLSRWYAKLCAPHLAATNAAMADKVASILRDVVAQDRAKTGSELIHRMYSVRPETAEKILPDGADWKEFLAARGVGWPEGSSIRFLPSIGKFVVENTVENLGKIERLFGQFNLYPFNPAWAAPGSYQITSRSAGSGSATSLDSHAESAEDAELSGRDEPTARPPDWKTYRILPSDPSAEEEAIYDKIERIVLPVFDVREADLAEVFSLLTDLSRENDPDESVPLERRGVEFVVRLDAGSDADVPLVTIKERDVSVEDVLDLVEEQADVKYRVEDGRVAVRRREDATGETFGRMFVPAIPSSAGDHDTPDDWKATFSTLGVRWPEGSSVELVADGSGVLVRNTFPELDVLASRHGTFDPRRLPTVFVDAQGLAPLQLRADGSTVVRPADRVVPSGAAQDRELVRLLEIPGRSRSPFPPGVEVDAKAPVRALKTVVDAISSVGFLPVVPFRIAGRPFVQWDNSASAPEVEIDPDNPDAPIPGFLFFGVEAVEHAWHPFPFSDGAPFPKGRHDRHVDAAGAAKAWRAACGPGKPDPKVVVFCDPDASCGRLHELMVSLQGAGAQIGVCVWGGNVFSPVANRLHAAQKAADDSRAESAEGAELSGGDAPTAHPPESTVVQSSREAVLANGFGWAYTFQLPGASAEETEERVGKPLERAFATIEGIRNVSVRIKEGSGIAVAEFAPDSDRTATKTAVADAVEAARQSMPVDAVVAGPVFSAVPRAAEPRDSTDAGAADNSDPLLPPEIGAGNLEPGTCEPANLRTRADDLPPATRAAVVRALFDFVSREVRYMGAMAESEAPGYEPHDVSLTFDNRYGVCRDKAALLVAMLRMAGIDAWPVLINVGPRKDAEVPQPYFNHAIVAADSGDPDDPYLLMDPTSETTRSLLPEYLCEKSYLVAREDGETIRETPPLPVEENMLRAHTVFTLNGDASADVTTTLSFLGVNDAAYRGYFASIPRDDIRAFFERLLRGVPGAVLTRWELHPAPEDLRKSPEPLVATVEYAVAEAARGAEGGRAAFLDLPDLAGSLAIASRVVGDLGLEKRRFPLVTDYPCGYEETVEIRLPDGVSAGSSASGGENGPAGE